MKTLGLLCCVWGRHDLALLTLKHNLAAARAAGLEVVPIVVGSEGNVSKEIAEQAEWGYVEHANSPLSNKWNAGIEAFRETKVEAVMIVGSDDLVHQDVFTALVRTTWAWGDTVPPAWWGLRDCYVLHGASGRVRHFLGYTGDRVNEPIGTCRTFSRWWLSIHNWRPWPNDLERGLDRGCELSPSQGTVLSMKDAGPVLDVKAYPLVDLGSFWSMNGPIIGDRTIITRWFPRVTFALWNICDPLNRTERLFDPEPKEPFISACILVRNERAGLSETLVSLQGLADEVCVLDTGSIDGTDEIAERFGCRVERVEAEQPFDFGRWRNASIKMARGKWVLLLDGDEWVIGAERIKQELTALPETCDVVAIKHRLLESKTAEGDSIIMRCLRGEAVRSGRIHYIYPVHHQLVGWTTFAVLPDDCYTEEPWYEVAESAPRALAALEKMLAQSKSPELVGLNGKALGGRKREREHALLYLARTHALIGGDLEIKAQAADGEERTKIVNAARMEYEKASLYAGELVDSNPDQAAAWLILLATVERARGLEVCVPIVDRALQKHPLLTDLHWWKMRICAATLAVLASRKDAYPLVPQRKHLYMPMLKDCGPCLKMRFLDPTEVPQEPVAAPSA